MPNPDFHDVDWVFFSVDPVIITIVDDRLHVLLVKRSREPFAERWALPGGRVDKAECDDLEQAVRKKLREKTGLDQAYFEQVFTDGGRNMDPRGWSVTSVYLALVRHDSVSLEPNVTGEDVIWQPIDELSDLGELAFWHRAFIERTIQRLRDRVTYTDLPLNLMPERFTLGQLRRAFEVVLGQTIPRPSFAKRIQGAGILEETGEVERGSHRPAALYRVKSNRDPYVFTRILPRE